MITIFKQGIPVVFEYAVNKTYKKSLHTTLLIVYHQRHVSVLQAIFMLNIQLWYELFITMPCLKNFKSRSSTHPPVPKLEEETV